MSFPSSDGGVVADSFTFAWRGCRLSLPQAEIHAATFQYLDVDCGGFLRCSGGSCHHVELPLQEAFWLSQSSPERLKSTPYRRPYIRPLTGGF